jgi:F0F1-type ATP synthase epsilon subunit
MNNKNNHAPALPTYPVQDNLGQVIVNFGFTKLEHAAVQIAAGLAVHAVKLEPETIAQEAIEIAEQVLLLCDQRLTEIQQSKPTLKL